MPDTMLSTEDALLLSIAANPDEQTPRDAYLDWLKEQDGIEYEEHARFIELSRQHDALPACPPVGSRENPAVPCKYFCERCHWLFDSRAFGDPNSAYKREMSSCQNPKCKAYDRRESGSLRKWGKYDEKHKIRELMYELDKSRELVIGRLMKRYPAVMTADGRPRPPIDYIIHETLTATRGGFVECVVLPIDLFGSKEGDRVIRQIFRWHPIKKVLLVRTNPRRDTSQFVPEDEEFGQDTVRTAYRNYRDSLWRYLLLCGAQHRIIGIGDVSSPLEVPCISGPDVRPLSVPASSPPGKRYFYVAVASGIGTEGRFYSVPWCLFEDDEYVSHDPPSTTTPNGDVVSFQRREGERWFRYDTRKEALKDLNNRCLRYGRRLRDEKE